MKFTIAPVDPTTQITLQENPNEDSVRILAKRGRTTALLMEFRSDGTINLYRQTDEKAAKLGLVTDEEGYPRFGKGNVFG